MPILTNQIKSNQTAGGADTKIRVHSGKLEGRKAIEVAMEPSTIKVFKNHRKGISRLLGMDL